jgi:transcriptional regulator with XRE-family HTH domain/tetratricopeptide (TPR) repeat protein
MRRAPLESSLVTHHTLGAPAGGDHAETPAVSTIYRGVVGIGFGDEVRRVRLAARLTQERLAERSGVSVRAIADLERGLVRRPRRDTVRRLADACGLTGAERQDFVAAAGDRYWADRSALPAGGERPVLLPADLSGFTGRAAELCRLDAELARAEAQPTAPGLVVVAGTAGVGKTSLAVHWAHRTADRFPGGRLYVDLRGFDPAAPPLPAGQAVRMFLDALEVAPSRLPAGLDAQVALYRRLVAGRRLLVLLDNARDAAQVRPLLPGAAAAFVLVTSRGDLPGLVAAEGARPLPLDVLDPTGARHLLAARLGATRLAAEPGAVDTVITRCAGLPLALAVAAARAATAPDLPLSTLAAALSGPGLSGLSGPPTTQDPDAPVPGAPAGADPATDVRVVFDCSYRWLSPAGARLLRLLGVHPGPDLAVPGAASLAGLPAGRVRPLLDELVTAHLLDRDGDRYRMHDLLRAYAAERAAADPEAPAARRRLLCHYTRAAHAADRLLIPTRDAIALDPPEPGTAPVPLADRPAALAWFTAEQRALVSSVDAAAAAGEDGYAWQLGWALLEYLDRWGHWADVVATQQRAVAATIRLGHRNGMALCHRGLGRGYRRVGRLDDAEAQLLTAAALFAELGIAVGEARTHLSLAGLAEARGRYDRTRQHAERALALFRAAGRPIGEGNALNTLAWALDLLGDHAAAVRHARAALPLLTAHADAYGLAATWHTLADAHHHLGHHGSARRCYLRAIRCYLDTNDRRAEAQALTDLATVRQATGEVRAAARTRRRATAIRAELDAIPPA